MATNPRIPSGDRKQPELVPNNDVIKPRTPGRPIGVLFGILAAAALLEAPGVEAALRRARREINAAGFSPRDAKARAKLLRALLNERATTEGIELN